MKEDVLVQFYKKHFNGIIPTKPDGRIRDYLNDMLPYYLRNLAKQEIVNVGHKLEGSRDSFSPKSEEEISYIVSCLKEEIQMDQRERCISRIKRTLVYEDDFNDKILTKDELDNMIEEEMKSADFQRLSYELDFYNKQLQDYIKLCDKYGVISKIEPNDNVVITKRR